MSPPTIGAPITGCGVEGSQRVDRLEDLGDKQRPRGGGLEVGDEDVVDIVKVHSNTTITKKLLKVMSSNMSVISTVVSPGHNDGLGNRLRDEGKLLTSVLVVYTHGTPDRIRTCYNNCTNTWRFE